MTTFRETVWIDYKEQVQYVLDHSNNECKQYPNNIPMFPPGPPPHSKIVCTLCTTPYPGFVTLAIFTAQNTIAGVRVDAWEWSTSARAGNNASYVAVYALVQLCGVVSS